MDIPDVLTLPDERLRQVAAQINAFDNQLAEQFQRLDTAMRNGPGGVGIAAPQLGMKQRILVVDCTLAQRPCKNNGLLMMVNPEIISRSEASVLGREGCLSVPEWVGMVPRARSIEVRFQRPCGEWLELNSRGFEARVIQHEMDHLDGVLFIDRVVSTGDLVRRMAKS